MTVNYDTPRPILDGENEGEHFVLSCLEQTALSCAVWKVSLTCDNLTLPDRSEKYGNFLKGL